MKSFILETQALITDVSFMDENYEKPVPEPLEDFIIYIQTNKYFLNSTGVAQKNILENISQIQILFPNEEIMGFSIVDFEILTKKINSNKIYKWNIHLSNEEIFSFEIKI